MKKVILKQKHVLGILLKKAASWHFSYYFLKKARPIACGIYVTNRCNLRCQMCNIWRNPQEETIPLASYKKIIDDLKNLGCYYVSLSGGEPLLVSDLDERLIYSKKKIPYLHMVTNGFLLDDAWAKRLAGIGINEVSISLDGLEEKHDAIRGIKGSFTQAWKAIHNLKKYAPKITIVVNSIISPNNISDLYEISRLVRKNNLLHKFQPHNDHPVFDNQKDESAKVRCSREDIEEIKKFIQFILPLDNIVN